MRILISIIFLILIFFSGIAYLLIPKEVHDGKAHIAWWTPYSPYRQEQVDAFNQLNPGSKLKTAPSFSWALSSMQKNLLQCSAGMGPDLFDSNNAQIESYAAAGIALDITDAAREGGFSTDAMWPTAKDTVLVNGRQYAYPANTGTSIVIYNKNLFDHFGVSYPKGLLTWEEFFDLSQKVTRQGKSPADTVYGVQNLAWPIFLASVGGEFFSEDGTKILLNSETTRKAVQMHMDCRKKYHITPTQAESASMLAQGGENLHSASLNLFSDGHFAMNVIGKWVLFQYRKTYQYQKEVLARWETDPHRDPAKKPELLRLGSFMIPHVAHQPPFYRVSTRNVIINARSPNKKAALDFLKYLSGPQYSSLSMKAMDLLPANPNYSQYTGEGAIPDLGEMEMHENTVESMKYGRTYQRSPFLFFSEILRLMDEQIQRLETNPQIPISGALNDIQLEAEKLMQRNLDRDPKLREDYQKLTGTTDVHQAQLSQKNVVLNDN